MAHRNRVVGAGAHAPALLVRHAANLSATARIAAKAKPRGRCGATPPPRRYGAPLRGRARRPRRPRLGSSSRLRTSTAVSYTHLRAHETDSSLVCRLLLEK